MRAFVEKREPDYMGIRKRAAQGRSSEFVWGPYRLSCSSCGTSHLPDEFDFCGKCGKEI
jgi:rRNA maturation endonuclease Nob1